MADWKLGATIGVVVGLASGITFSIMSYIAALGLLYNQSISLGPLILAGIVAGTLIGLCAGLVYTYTRDSLPGRSSRERALALASMFSLPLALSWLFALPLTNSVASSEYMQWIHSFGIEIHWFDINTSPPQITDLAGFLNMGAYLATYILIVVTWVFVFGGLLGYLWDKKVQSSGERRSK